MTGNLAKSHVVRHGREDRFVSKWEYLRDKVTTLCNNGCTSREIVTELGLPEHKYTAVTSIVRSLGLDMIWAVGRENKRKSIKGDIPPNHLHELKNGRKGGPNIDIIPISAPDGLTGVPVHLQHIVAYCNYRNIPLEVLSENTFRIGTQALPNRAYLVAAINVYRAKAGQCLIRFA